MTYWFIIQSCAIRGISTLYFNQTAPKKCGPAHVTCMFASEEVIFDCFDEVLRLQVTVIQEHAHNVFL